MFHVVCKHGFTESQTGTTPIPIQDMGHTIDFLDIHIYDLVDRLEDILKNKGYSTNRDLLMKAITKPHRTVCSPVNYEEERKIAIRDGFMEMLRKELLNPSLEKDVKEQSLSGY